MCAGQITGAEAKATSRGTSAQRHFSDHAPGKPVNPVKVVPDVERTPASPALPPFGARSPKSRSRERPGDAPLFQATKHEVNRATADRRHGARDLQLVAGDLGQGLQPLFLRVPLLRCDQARPYASIERSCCRTSGLS